MYFSWIRKQAKENNKHNGASIFFNHSARVFLLIYILQHPHRQLQKYTSLETVQRVSLLNVPVTEISRYKY